MHTPAHAQEMRTEFVTGLINAHALEKEAMVLMQRQIDRLEHYPELTQRLREHLAETHRQEDRLDELLDRFDESRSMFKDVVMQLGATMSATAHAMADDEILKNTFASHAFENFEIAAYTSLIAMAKACGFEDMVPVLRESLAEEERMAEWLRAQVEPITLRYLALKGTDETAGR